MQDRSLKELNLLFTVPAETADGPGQLRHPIENRHRAQPLTIVDGRGAADGRAGGNIAGNPGLRSGNRAVADRKVSGHAHLPGEDYVVADLRRTSNADLRAQHGMFADRASVPDLDKVVDLGIGPDPGLPDAGAV